MGRLPGMWFFCVDARQGDGVVFYKVLGRTAVVLKIAPDGMVDAGKLRDCHRKSFQQLRETGRAFDLYQVSSRP